MTYMIDQPAPQTLQAALRMAAKDLERVAKDPRYVVNMNIWHWPKDGICSVCFAGAVMSGHIPSRDHIGNLCDNFNPDWKDVFTALDHFRQGCLVCALKMMGQMDLWSEQDGGKWGFDGKLDDLETQDLIKHARAFADELDRRQADLYA